MTDRELLEAAAKAAGMSRTYYEYEFTGDVGMMDDDPDGVVWNPLTDDGDALRLAVKLGLAVAVNNPSFIEVAIIKNGEVKTLIRHQEAGKDWNYDPYITTRRAIVHAAAEIGRNT